MGLAERRSAKAFQDGPYVELKQQIDEAAGFELPVEVKWDQLALDDYGHMYEEAWPKVYFHPLIAALKSITADDMGKEALQESLKKVVIQNVSGKSLASAVAAFSAGVLTLDHKPITNIDQVTDRTAAIRTTLEKAL